MAIDRTGDYADGIGARVFLIARVDEGQSSTQVVEVLGSSSFLSLSSPDLGFGMGGA